jgi:type I restriction enzyme, R subunit
VCFSKGGHLINPTVVDARTSVTTKLLSDQGFIIEVKDDNWEDRTASYSQRDFERKFFADRTNKLFCKIFIENAFRDPISGEIGKSIIFAVSQNHAARLAQILNEMADIMFPGKYQSDFAVQGTSQVDDAQQMTINFTNNKLLGSENFLPTYKTSKARVCVTVGMMTTGYDCPDLLNLGLFRPIFWPTDFIQIKGRGTRRHNFLEELGDASLKEDMKTAEKTAYKLFDFFAVCQYFEEEFNYDQIITLPSPGGPGEPGLPGPAGLIPREYDHTGDDVLSTIKEEAVGAEGSVRRANGLVQTDSPPFCQHREEGVYLRQPRGELSG